MLEKIKMKLYKKVNIIQILFAFFPHDSNEYLIFKYDSSSFFNDNSVPYAADLFYYIY